LVFGGDCLASDGPLLDTVRTLLLWDPDKIRELARKGEAWGDSEKRQKLEHAIETRRGGVYLRLTPDQYRKLRRP
jgi:hypothetical protein